MSVEITDVQATQVEGEFSWTFLRIYTDAGVTGTGECYWGPGVRDTVESAADWLEGRDPRDVDRLCRYLFERTQHLGSLAGSTVSAISGLDIALHDLAGKVRDEPAFRLLGGRYRDEARVYVDCHAGVHQEATKQGEADDDAYLPESYADAAEDAISEGYDALKFDLDADRSREDDPYNRHLDAEAVEHKRRIVEAIDERVGFDANVAYDCHWSYDRDSAVRLAEAIEPYGVWWLEDVVPPENLDVQRELTRATNTTICTGENLYRTHGVRQLIEEQAVDVLQPDMPKFGGMRETVDAARAADDYYIPVALHNVSSPLGTMAGAHVGVAIPNYLAVEFHGRNDEGWSDFVEEDVIVDGAIPVSEEPGLGVTLDLDAVEERMADGETLLDPE
jgi:L-alanine-DL-glutamate epimerase-like enolase superfamily enzyme